MLVQYDVQYLVPLWMVNHVASLYLKNNNQKFEERKIQLNPYECLGCIKSFTYDRIFHYLRNYDNVEFLGSFFKNETLKKFICRMANRGGGFIFQGMRAANKNEDGPFYVEGLEFIDESQQENYLEKIEKNCLSYIYPFLSKEEYKIDFLPVVEDFTLEFQEANKIIIRIEVRPKRRDCEYFIMKENKEYITEVKDNKSKNIKLFFHDRMGEYLPQFTNTNLTNEEIGRIE